MRTLFLTQDFPPDSGGIARLYGELCRRFPAGSVHVGTVRAADAEVARVADTSLQPVRVTRLAFTFRQARRLSSVVRWSRWALRQIKGEEIDLIQVGNIRPAGYVAAYVHARLGVPYTIYVHGKDLWKEQRKVERSARARWTARAILGRAGSIIANSRATAERAEALLRTLEIDPAGRIHIVHPGTDPQTFRPEVPGTHEWRAELGLQDERILLSLSRLMARKGVDTALHAFGELVDRYPDLMYVVAGDGPEREHLEALAGRLGLRERVRFLGAVDDARLPALYAAADLFVLPVREEPDDHEVEGFGIVFCEAAAAGLPIVAGRSGGIEDAVREGKNALLVPPADPHATADAVARILDDEVLRQQMSDAGREAVEEYYHWDRAAAEAWTVLEQTAALSSPGEAHAVHAVTSRSRRGMP